MAFLVFLDSADVISILTLSIIWGEITGITAPKQSKKTKITTAYRSSISSVPVKGVFEVIDCLIFRCTDYPAKDDIIFFFCN
jgi:hypothetical protein